MRSIHALSLLLVVALAAGVAPVSAQDARADFERGVRHAGAGQWEDALAAFRASLAATDRARTLFNVAVALDRLERGPECVRTIDALLTRDDVDASDREEAETLRRRWAARLGAFVLRVAPQSATVRVDGEIVGGEGSARRVLLTPGTHRLLVEAPGHRSREEAITLSAGGERRLEVTLDPAPLEVAGGGVALRPLDRATVRIVALRGAETVGSDGAGSLPTVVPRAAHGSGVVVHRDGWILTARHVVEGADHLVVLLPGETRAVAARTAWLDPERDLAFVRVAEPLGYAIALENPPGLVLGQAVDASGYPLDPTERWPNASAGQLGRPLNDGRVQLSIALNPGNSGGPVAVEGGRLIGVVSQGGDPGRGVQNVVVMEPIGPVVDRLAQLLAAPAEVPVADPVDGLLVELIDAAEPPPVVRRLARLRGAAQSPPGDVRGALWALEAEATRRAILRSAHARMPSELAPDLRALFDEATAHAATLTSGFISQPTLAGRYAPLRALTVPTRSGNWDCGLGGICTQRFDSDDPGRGWLFDFTITSGLAVDDDQRASFVEGAMFGVLGLFHLGNFGALDPLRFNVLLGAEVSLGTWRREVVFDLLADIGVRLAVGDPDYAVAVQLLYTPGPISAEGGWSFAYLAYRATVSFQLAWFGLGLSWHEVGRGADDTQRSLELLLSWGI